MPAGSRAAWSRIPLLPLAPSRLTPFSYSIIAEIASRAWFHYYDALGYDPMPRARVVREVNGGVYFNQTLSAQREAEVAAIEPITLRIDGTPFPLAKVEKSGFLAGFKASRSEKKLEKYAESLQRDVAAMREAAKEWYDKVSGFRWTQADILMAMEEIEPISVQPFAGFLGVRQQILLAVNRLMRWSGSGAGVVMQEIDRGLGASEGVVEAEMARALDEMARRIPAGTVHAPFDSPAIEAGSAPSPEVSTVWQPLVEAWGIGDAFKLFLARYDYRALAPAEIAQPRFGEDPAPLLRCLEAGPFTAHKPEPDAIAALLASVDAGQRKAAQEAVDHLRVLIPLQSQLLDVLSLLFAGARKWAWGAAHEASLDQRIVTLGDVFFFELEELKEMMTGEWNISDRSGIQSTAQKRKLQVKEWEMTAMPDLLIGESAATPQDIMKPSPVLEPALLLAAHVTEVAHP